MCRLPQGPKNSSSIFQNCIESTLKRIKGVVIFQDDVLVHGTTKDQYEKRMLAAKCWLREKIFTINEKKSNSKPVSSVSFLGYSVSKEGIAPDPKNAKPPISMKALESLVGLANFYGRMIPDFATKLLTIHNGITFLGDVPCIPPKLRPMVIAKAHETHPGKQCN